jgi:hypothetical protein
MASFTPAGLWQILTALPELKTKEAAFRDAMDKVGMAYSLPDYAGVRTEAQQAQLVAWRDAAVAQGEPWYPVAPPGSTYHEYGAAFDITITTPANPQDSDYAMAAEVGTGVGLNAGYFFDSPDPFHFELDYSIAQVQQMWTAHTATVVATTGGISVGVLALIGGGLWLLSRMRGG